jgi:predicted transcriptional regulator
MPQKILSLKEIKKRLIDKKTRFSDVSKITGIARQTLYNIIDGKTVYSETQETLSGYFTNIDLGGTNANITN